MRWIQGLRSQWTPGQMPTKDAATPELVQSVDTSPTAPEFAPALDDPPTATASAPVPALAQTESWASSKGTVPMPPDDGLNRGPTQPVSWRESRHVRPHHRELSFPVFMRQVIDLVSQTG